MNRLKQIKDMPEVIFDLMKQIGFNQKFIVLKARSEDEVFAYAAKKNLDVQLLTDKDKKRHSGNSRRYYVVGAGMIFKDMSSEVDNFTIMFYEIDANRYFTLLNKQITYIEQKLKERECAF